MIEQWFLQLIKPFMDWTLVWCKKDSRCTLKDLEWFQKTYEELYGKQK